MSFCCCTVQAVPSLHKQVERFDDYTVTTALSAYGYMSPKKRFLERWKELQTMHAPESVSKKNKIICYCGDRFRNEDGQHRHERHSCLFKLVEISYQCICSKNYAILSGLQRHQEKSCKGLKKK